MKIDTDQTPIRVGLVGAGSHARRNILPTLGFLPIDLVAVADADADRARDTAAQYGADRSFSSAKDMLAWGELDAVLLVVSPVLHPQLASEAFEAGFDVWSEKPAAVASSEIDAMIGARGDRVCVVGYKKAFMPAARKVRELLARSDESALRSALGVYSVDIPLATGPAPYPVSSWLTSGCHPLSLLRSVGGPVDRVAVHRSQHGGAACVLYHRDGNISNLHASFGMTKHQPNERYLFITDEHSIEIQNSRRVVFQRAFDVEYSEDWNFAPEGLGTGAIVWEAQDTMATMQGKNVVTQGILGGLAAFVDAVRTRTDPEIGSLEFARDVTRIYEAAQRSDGDIVSI